MYASGTVAAVASTNRAETEALLASAVFRLRASGAKVVGVLAETSSGPQRVAIGACRKLILRVARTA